MGRFDKLKQALGIKLDPEGYSDDQLLQQPIAGEESGPPTTYDRASDGHLHQIPVGSMDTPDQGPSLLDRANQTAAPVMRTLSTVMNGFDAKPPEQDQRSENIKRMLELLHKKQ